MVDDEKQIRRLAARMQGPDQVILTAANGDEALLFCELFRGAIQLMVTDVTMPGMNGFDLAQQVVERWPSIQLLFISGFASDRAIRRQVDGRPLLQKPFTRDDLMNKVDGLLTQAVSRY